MNPQNNPIPPKNYWRRCSTCKKEIGFGEVYQRCSVSTCRQKRTGLIFCSVMCWDAHLGFARHRDAYAEENKAPSLEEFNQSEEKRISMEQNQNQPKRIIPQSSSGPSSSSSVPTDTLVVVSKVKKLIKDQSGMNTSQCAIDALTQKVVDEAFRAIESAQSQGRKTVMGRDF